MTKKAKKKKKNRIDCSSKKIKNKKINPLNKVKPHVVEVTPNAIFNPQRGGQAEALLTLNLKPKQGQPPETSPATTQARSVQ